MLSFIGRQLRSLKNSLKALVYKPRRKRPVVNPVINLAPRYEGVAPRDRWDQIEYAFTSGGRHYFRFTSEVNIPFQRAIAARDILTEELWQITPVVLQGWAEGLISLVTDQKKPIEKRMFEIGIMANRLKEQLGISFSLTRQMKLATVLYFDETENPLDYQYNYNAEKLKQWTADNDISGFFLRLPDVVLMPSSTEFIKNFPTYLEAESKSQMDMLRHIIGSISQGNTDDDLMNSILSEMATLTELNNWSKSPSTNII